MQSAQDTHACSDSLVKSIVSVTVCLFVNAIYLEQFDILNSLRYRHELFIVARYGKTLEEFKNGCSSTQRRAGDRPITSRRICLARTMPWQDVCLSVRTPSVRHRPAKISSRALGTLICADLFGGRATKLSKPAKHTINVFFTVKFHGSRIRLR